MNRFQFVEDHKDAWGVKRVCEVVEVARASFYAWLAAAPTRAARAAADAALVARIQVLQDPARGGDRAYGAPRVTADLHEGTTPGDRVNHKRVARVMREHGLAGIRLRKRVRTTIPDQSGRRFPDLIGRDFSIGVPCCRYVGDITYLPIADGTNLYLASCIDLGSRKLAGWSMADHMRTELVEDALKAAWHERGSLVGTVFHSDHGAVYTSKAYAQLCTDLGVTQSMGAIGSSADNALAESFNAALKRDLLRGVTLPAVRHDLTSLSARHRGQQDDSHNDRTYETGSAHLRRWRTAFLAYFDTAGASNGGTEAINGIIELGRRIARGFRNFEHYRLRMLLITGGLDASPHTQL